MALPEPRAARRDRVGNLVESLVAGDDEPVWWRCEWALKAKKVYGNEFGGSSQPGLRVELARK